MALDYDALKSDIEGGPLAAELAPLAEAGRDQDVADALNRKDRPGRKLVDLWQIKLAAIEGGFWPAIKVAAASHPVPEIKAVADTVLDYVDDRRFSTIDPHRESTSAMLGALVAGSVITQEHADALTALADTTVSRAEELFGSGTVIGNMDIAKALRG